MTEPAGFVLALLIVLLTPGPTNTLLATASATAGWRSAALLVPAEIAGYLLSIVTLLFALGPAFGESSAVRSGLRLACGVYLVFLTWKLWGVGAGLRERTPVRFREVFVTTLLNPKGLVFALVIFPVPAGRAVSLTPYFAMFVIVCVMVAAAWIAAGAILHGRQAGRAVAPGVFRRLGAVVLGVFALFLLASGLMV